MSTYRIRNAIPADVPEIFAMVCELAEYEKALHEVQQFLHADGRTLPGLLAVEMPAGR